MVMDIKNLSREELKKKGFNDFQIKAIIKGDCLGLARETAFNSGRISDYIKYFSIQELANNVQKAQTEVYEEGRDGGLEL